MARKAGVVCSTSTDLVKTVKWVKLSRGVFLRGVLAYVSTQRGFGTSSVPTPLASAACASCTCAVLCMMRSVPVTPNMQPNRIRKMLANYGELADYRLGHQWKRQDLHAADQRGEAQSLAKGLLQVLLPILVQFAENCGRVSLACALSKLASFGLTALSKSSCLRALPRRLFGNVLVILLSNMPAAGQGYDG